MGNTYVANTVELISAITDPATYVTANTDGKHCNRCSLCIPQMADIGSNLSPNSKALPQGKLIRNTKTEHVSRTVHVANCRASGSRKTGGQTAFRFELDPGFSDGSYNTVDMNSETESSPDNSGSALDGIVLNAMPFEKGHSNLAIFGESHAEDSDARSCISEFSVFSDGDGWNPSK